MEARLLGVQPIQFTNSNGEEVKGCNIYIAFEEERVHGLRTEKLFLRDGIELPKDTKINDVLSISFNMKGKPERVSKA